MSYIVRYRLIPILAAAAALSVAPAIRGGDASPIPLPAPKTEGGKPLMDALKQRQSARAFSPEKLSMQTVSNLLWAAFGVNRPDGRRTAPSAMNRQELEIYVAAADGLRVYEAAGHRLRPVLDDDLRAQTGTQDFVRDAALSLVYVADFAKMGASPEQDRILYSAADTGFIAQNVYLFCASEGLATVVRASVDRDGLAKAMRLRPDQRIVLVQSVGYPKK
jgi:SagB-type dehydrogenase family enzyme